MRKLLAVVILLAIPTVGDLHVPEVDGRFETTFDVQIPRWSNYTNLRGTVLFTDASFYFGSQCTRTYGQSTSEALCQVSYNAGRLEIRLGACHEWAWNNASSSQQIRFVYDAYRRVAHISIRRPVRGRELCGNSSATTTLRAGYINLNAPN